MSFGINNKDRIQWQLERVGGYDKHGHVFSIARPLTGSVSFPVKTFPSAAALEQFINEYTFFRYWGRCPTWRSVLNKSDCFSNEERDTGTLKGKMYTPEGGRDYVIQLISSGELVVHRTGNWIQPKDRNHHSLRPKSGTKKVEFLPPSQTTTLGPHEESGYVPPVELKVSGDQSTVVDESIIINSGITKKESKIPGVDAKIAEADINEALRVLKDQLKAKKQALSVWNANTQAELTHWFGSNSEESRRLISDRIDATLKVVNNFSIDNFEQAEPQHAQEGLYAYVYSTKEDKIYLGNEFGNAPIMGRDSKAGTIAHEISHYKSVGGTDDHEYGEEECVGLAKDDPDKALDNADNFQYFIEGDSNE